MHVSFYSFSLQPILERTSKFKRQPCTEASRRSDTTEMEFYDDDTVTLERWDYGREWLDRQQGTNKTLNAQTSNWRKCQTTSGACTPLDVETGHCPGSLILSGTEMERARFESGR